MASCNHQSESTQSIASFLFHHILPNLPLVESLHLSQLVTPLLLLPHEAKFAVFDFVFSMRAVTLLQQVIVEPLESNSV